MTEPTTIFGYAAFARACLGLRPILARRHRPGGCRFRAPEADLPAAPPADPPLAAGTRLFDHGGREHRRRSELIEGCRLEPEHVVAIYNPVDVDDFRKRAHGSACPWSGEGSMVVVVGPPVR